MRSNGIIKNFFAAARDRIVPLQHFFLVGRLKGQSEECRSVALPPFSLDDELFDATYNFDICFVAMIHY